MNLMRLILHSVSGAHPCRVFHTLQVLLAFLIHNNIRWWTSRWCTRSIPVTTKKRFLLSSGNVLTYWHIIWAAQSQTSNPSEQKKAPTLRQAKIIIPALGVLNFIQTCVCNNLQRDCPACHAYCFFPAPFAGSGAFYAPASVCIFFLQYVVYFRTSAMAVMALLNI